ncbi:clostripain-related cysteine peptidase [Prevotella corporis]|uniref:Clostripain family protein n=1 Tax=Prevotella corporis TaxID=28128 RepID=A0A133Q6X7_9BACT|nr:clostripain-related cysteine peptidase [Prevotella corporis]KXA38612.1 hypothetical protein HMPREF3226_01573 [Prevotella corporis]
MKRILFVIFTLLSLFSCGNKNDIEIDEELLDADKTILMYLPWTGQTTLNSKGQPINAGLYSAFNKNIRGIEKSIETFGSSQKTRTFVLIADKPSSVYLYEITFEKGKCKRDTLEHYVNMPTNGKSLTEYIRKVKRLSPTPLFSMIMGAHGSGWLPKNKARHKTRSIGGITTTFQFDIAEIAKAITDNGIKLQFLCFDDCYMANIEVAYELRNATNYLIASTSEIMDSGIPYEKVYRYMASQQPDYKSITSGFLEFYSGTNPYPYGSLSVMDCNYMNEIVDLMKKFNNSGVAAPNDKEVSPQDPYGPNRHIYYDFGDYLRKYNNHIREQGMDSIKYADIISKFIPCKVKTKELFTMYYDPYLGNPYTIDSYSGTTISDPSISPDVITNKLNTGWWKATH